MTFHNNSELQVRIWGLDANGKMFNQFVPVIDIGANRARLERVGVELKTDDVIGVSRGEKKSRFRILWVGGDRHRGQLEMEMVLPPVDDFWGNGIRNREPYVPGTERRTMPRYRCSGSAELLTNGRDYATRASIVDLAMNGCYVEMFMPFRLGTHLRIAATVIDVTFEADAEVVSSHPGVGMGLRFDPERMKGAELLAEVLQRLDRDSGCRLLR